MLIQAGDRPRTAQPSSMAKTDMIEQPIIANTAPQRAAEADLTKLQPHRWFLALALDWAIVVAAFAVAGYANHPLVYVLAMFVIGTRIQALGILGHEAAHRLITKNAVFDEWVGKIFCFLPIGLSSVDWREFHLKHHRHFGTALDPELIGKQNNAPKWDLPLNRKFIAKMFVLDLIGIGVVDLFRLQSASPGSDKLTRVQRFFDSFSFLIGLFIITALTHDLWIFAMWMGALLTSAWALTRQRTLLEHLGTGGTNRFHATWWQRALFLPHNIWVHYEHHRYALIPYYNLRKARARDTREPVLTIGALLDSYEKSAPIASGAVLR